MSLSVTTLKRRKTNRLSQVPIAQKVKLERVLGLTVNSTSCLAVDPKNGIVAYPAGCTTVLYSAKKNLQAHIINLSKKPITCLTFSSDGRYLATGESGHQPKVRVWDILSDNSQIAELTDHKFGIVSVAFSPNGAYLVSVGNQHDMTVNVWNWKTGKKAASNKVSCKVHKLCFGEAGNYFVTAGVRHVKFWYMEAKNKLQDAIPLQGRSAILADLRNNNFCDVACGKGPSASSTFCITQSGLLCDFNDRRMLEKWMDLRVKSANALSLSGTEIFVGCSDGIVRVFRAENLSFIATLPLPHNLGVDVASLSMPNQSAESNPRHPDVLALCYEAENMRVTCVYADHSLYQWDVHDFKRVGKTHSALYHSAAVWHIDTAQVNSSSAPIPVDSFLTCSNDDTVRVWNIDPNMPANRYYKHNMFSPELLKSFYLDPDYSYLCDADAVSEKSDLERRNGVRIVKLSPNGQDLACGDRSGNLKILNLIDSSLVREIEAHDSEVLLLEYSGFTTNSNLLASGSRDRMIHILSVDDQYEPVFSIEGHSSAVIAATFVEMPIAPQDDASSGNSDALFLISCGTDRLIVFHRLTLEPEPQYARTHCIVTQMAAYDMQLDAARRHLFVACQDRQIRVYNVLDGKLNRTFKASTADDGTLLKLSLDQSAHYVATSTSDKSLAIYITKTGECAAAMYGHSENSTGLRFSHDYRRLISVSADSCIYIWRLASDLTARLVELSQHRPNRQRTLTGDFSNTTDDDQSVPDDASSCAGGAATGSGSVPSHRSSSTEDPPPLSSARPSRSRWGAPAQSAPASSDFCSDAKRQFDLDQLNKEAEMNTLGKISTRNRVSEASKFGSLANMNIIDNLDDPAPEGMQTKEHQNVIYENQYPLTDNDRQFEVKERNQTADKSQLTSYSRSSTYGNDMSDEDELRNGADSNSFDAIKSLKTLEADQFDSVATRFDEMALESSGKFGRNTGVRLSITSRYIQTNRSMHEDVPCQNDANIQALKPQPRARWQPKPTGVSVAVVPATPESAKPASATTTPSKMTPKSEEGAVLWAYKGRAPLRSSSVAHGTATTPIAEEAPLVDPNTVLRAKALQDLAKVKERRQSMPDYSYAGGSSYELQRRDSKNSLFSGCSSNATVTRRCFGGGSGQPNLTPQRYTGAMSLYDGAAGGDTLRRITNSLSMSSLTHSADSSQADSSEARRKISEMREKLRKSQENLARLMIDSEASAASGDHRITSTPVSSGLRSKSIGNLAAKYEHHHESILHNNSNAAAFVDQSTPRNSSERWSSVTPAMMITKSPMTTSTSDFAKSFDNLTATQQATSQNEQRPLANTLAQLSRLSRSDLTRPESVDRRPNEPASGGNETFYSTVSLPRYKKATPTGVQKKLSAIKARQQRTPLLDDPTATPHRYSSVAALKRASTGAGVDNNSPTGVGSPSRRAVASQHLSTRFMADDERAVASATPPLAETNNVAADSVAGSEIFDGAHYERMSCHCRDTGAEFKTTLDKLLHAYRLVVDDSELGESERSALIAVLSAEMAEARRRLEAMLQSGASATPRSAAPAANTNAPTMAISADNLITLASMGCPSADPANPTNAFLHQCSEMLVAMIQQKMTAPK